MKERRRLTGMATRKYSLCGAGTVVPVDALTWQGQQQRKGVVRSGKPDKHADPGVPLGIKRKINHLVTLSSRLSVSSKPKSGMVK
jgi:hypothetical protein